MEHSIITDSEKETQGFAKNVLSKLGNSHLICLYGDLGSGKTTFTQGLASVFNIKRLISPTFIIMRRYLLKKSIFAFFYHIDLYRIDKSEEIQALGIEEIIGDKKNLAVIEWADKMQKLLPKNRIDICFEYLSESKRKITMFYN